MAARVPPVAGEIPQSRIHTFPALILFLTFSILLIESPSFAQRDFEAAAAVFGEDTRQTLLFSAAGSTSGKWFHDGEGLGTSLRLGGSFKKINFTDEADPIAKDQLKGASILTERSFNIQAEQGLRIGSKVGAMLGRTYSDLAVSRWFGFRVGEWWLQETLQTVLEFRRSVSDVTPLDVTDTDGARILTPAVIDGNTWSLSVTHFTTPSTILLGGATRTERRDRPDAWSFTGEIRQFIDASDGALHVAMGHYENLGTVRQVSLIGEVVSNSLRMEWHQRVGPWIIAPGYRWYAETEDPRAADAPSKTTGTDSIYATLRWRWDEGQLWVADQPESYAFFGRYVTSEPRTVNWIGLGSRLLW